MFKTAFLDLLQIRKATEKKRLEDEEQKEWERLERQRVQLQAAYEKEQAAAKVGLFVSITAICDFA